MSLTNQQKAQTYHRAVSSYDVATVKSMIREDYIQHNPRVPTGAAAFLALFPNLEKQIVAQTPLGRIGQPQDIANIAVFLASDDSGWMTGERLQGSGGLR